MPSSRRQLDRGTTCASTPTMLHLWGNVASMMNRAVWLLAIGACGKAVPDAKPGAGSEPSRDGEAARPAASTCLPADGFLEFGRDGAQLSICQHELTPGDTDDSFARIARCWVVDGNTGALSARNPTPLPGSKVGLAKSATCHDGMCWPPYSPEKDRGPVEDRGHYFQVALARHPAGKRAAVVQHDLVHILDVATKSVTRSFRIQPAISTQDDVSAAPFLGVDHVWFTGDTVFIRSLPVGGERFLLRYSASTGRPLPAYGNLNGVGIAGSTMTVNEGDREVGLTRLTVLDGTSTDGATTKRADAKSPCELGLPEPGRDCSKPYDGVQLVPDPVGFIGLDVARGRDLIRLDAKLVETSRKHLATCESPL